MPYYYLISSLPMLALGEKIPMTSEEFLSNCSDWVSKSKYKQLCDVSLNPDTDQNPKNKTVIGWYNWETCLRNRIAKTRSTKLEKDISKYTKEERDAFSEIDRGIQESFAADNPKLREKILDELRWKEIDNLESGHLFDLGKLCIYKLRLMLCEKWLDREYEKGQSNLDKALKIFYSGTKPKGQEAAEGKNP